MHKNHPFITPFSPDPDRDFELRCVLGAAVAGAADPGEVLATTSQVKRKDNEGWHQAWLELGRRTAAAASDSADGGHTVSASMAYLRASNYLGVAVNAISSLADDSELVPTFRECQSAWDKFVDLTATKIDRIEIPYDPHAMPGYVFHPIEPNGAALVAVNGSDGCLAALYASCIEPALDRGYTVLTFDGPGQQSMLFENGVPFRPDWENVLPSVYDAVADLDGVNPERVAIYGISQGGYWVPRGLSGEHRFAAAIADPGVVDVSTSWTGHFPKGFLKLLDEGKTEKFNKDMAIGMKFSPDTAHTWRFRSRPYGLSGYGEVVEAVRTYNLRDVAKDISTPLLITNPEGEQFWPGQSEELAKLSSGPSTVIAFTAAEGADLHCQPLARGLTAERMFDWLDGILARN